MIAYKVVRIIDGERVSAIIDACQWRKSYPIKRRLVSKGNTGLLAFNGLQHAKYFRAEYVLHHKSEIWKCEIEKMPAHHLVNCNDLFGMSNLREYWRGVKDSCASDNPAGTVFCKSIKLIEKVA